MFTIMYECVWVIQGTQKSIDKARELIDEVLSRPDKEYEAAKHQLGHSSNHFQQQNRSFEVWPNSYAVAIPILTLGNIPLLDEWW